jgi:glycosyltransferase involved in cell wall biosynthesis
LTLKVSGGYTGDDKSFIMKQMKKISKAGFSESVKIYPEFAGLEKREFLGSIDVLCVPVRKHDGYGLYLLEANAAGVPVIQPATGAFPEIIARTGGGITYNPDTIMQLADTLEKYLIEKETLKKLGREGKENVIKNLSLVKMSEGLSEVYKSVIS